MANRKMKPKPIPARRRYDEAAKQELEQLGAEVQAALKLLDSSTADAIITGANSAGTGAAANGDKQPEEYGELIRGTKAAMGMYWAACKSHGLRESPTSLRYGAQTLSILLTLVHYAYALGLQRGREEQGE